MFLGVCRTKFVKVIAVCKGIVDKLRFKQAIYNIKIIRDFAVTMVCVIIHKEVTTRIYFTFVIFNL